MTNENSPLLSIIEKPIILNKFLVRGEQVGINLIKKYIKAEFCPITLFVVMPLFYDFLWSSHPALNFLLEYKKK